jgi:isopentenyl-diphosphate delta-isomerase
MIQHERTSEAIEMNSAELVSLVDENGNPVGVADKAGVHTRHTALHLAFSCYVRNAENQILVTRRALTKQAWPGVWTNSFCGHPAPGEDETLAIERRAAWELGITLYELSPALPDFRYYAVDPSGIVENEICPVYFAMTEDVVQKRPSEVIEHTWVDSMQLRNAVSSAPWAFSPWMKLQLAELHRIGWEW